MARCRELERDLEGSCRRRSASWRAKPTSARSILTKPFHAAPPPPYSPQHPPLRHDTTAPTERPGAPYAATQPSLDGSRRPGVGTSTAQLASASTTRDQRPLTGRTNDVVAPQFPPPPPTDRRARSSSRTRNERTQPLFSLSALASRVRSSSQATTINRPEADYAEGSTSQKVSVANSRRARTVHAR